MTPAMQLTLVVLAAFAAGMWTEARIRTKPATASRPTPDHRDLVPREQLDDALQRCAVLEAQRDAARGSLTLALDARRQHAAAEAEQVRMLDAEVRHVC